MRSSLATNLRSLSAGNAAIIWQGLACATWASTTDDHTQRFMMSEKLWYLAKIVLVGTLITDVALELFWRRLPRLQKLNVQGVASVSPPTRPSCMSTLKFWQLINIFYFEEL